jgi:MSHA biogenesis protein MshN
MSVINRVLRDLEQRHAAPGRKSLAKVPVRAVGVPDRGGRATVLAACTAGLALTAVSIAALHGWSIPATATAAEAPAKRGAVIALAAPAVAAPGSSAVMPSAVAPVRPREVATKRPRGWSVAGAKDGPPEPPLVGRTRFQEPVVDVEPLAAPAAPSTVGATGIDRQERPLGPVERAENAFLMGIAALRNGHATEAEARFRVALDALPAHVGARQALLGLMLDSRRSVEAEALMRAGMVANPDQISFAMVAARLQAQRGDAVAAILTLESVQGPGSGHGDFVALHAAMLQRIGRHGEAAQRYSVAIGLGNAQPVWYIGRAISLQQIGKDAEARASFRQAIDTGSLPPELRAFAERQLGTREAG